jgi:hypothetical protein
MKMLLRLQLPSAVFFNLEKAETVVNNSSLGQQLNAMVSHFTQEPILRLLNLQLQRKYCSMPERFSKKKKHFCFQKALGYLWRLIRDRRIGSWVTCYSSYQHWFG